MRLKIVQAGDPVLRGEARELSISEIRSRPVQELIERMRDTMRDAPGVGLAAPQIGEPLQLAVIEDREEYLRGADTAWVAERERSAVPFHVIINPRLTVVDAEPLEFFEGCLSVGGFTALVPRARAVRVECRNEQADRVVIDAHGWYARILQHEIDHLHGRLYVDRMEPRSFMTTANHARHWREQTTREVRAALGLRTRIWRPGRAPAER
ncbi:MAG: peptide deformylase [Deltaproteobacteria bacterium]|nr:peptide deformylase [Deltaproteobacteria bacterium]